MNMTDKSAQDNYIDQDELVFTSSETLTESSSSSVRNPSAQESEADVAEHSELTGVAARLAPIELPRLQKENRARLQMQTPNRLYFYWSLKHEPYHILNKAVAGGASGYQLVLKLVNLTRELEEIHPAETVGNYWFNVDSNCDYRCEVGLYAPSRPYIRILYSNTITTPRRRPSPRVATDRDWIVKSEDFASVLKVSGFEQDAFSVAIGGEDKAEVRHNFEDLIGTEVDAALDLEELKYALLHLSLGLPLETLRWRIDASLFKILQQYLAQLSAESVRAMLKERFGVESDEMVDEEPSGAIYGMSEVSFPRKLRRRRNPISGYQPVSSFSR
jgi:hypothetical protein